MTRHIAFRVAVALSAVGSLVVACSSAPDSDDSSNAFGQALERVGTGESPVLLHDAGHESGLLTPVGITPLVTPFWATQCTTPTTRFFVRHKPVANATHAALCAAVDSPTGKWTGAPLFPDAPDSPQCVYNWAPDTAGAQPNVFDLYALESAAALTRHNHPDVKPQCSATTCGIVAGASCDAFTTSAPCDPDASPDGGCPHNHVETGPICESCAVVHSGALMVVLPPSNEGVRYRVKPIDTTKRAVEFALPSSAQTFTVPVQANDFAEGDVLDVAFAND